MALNAASLAAVVKMIKNSLFLNRLRLSNFC
jgi:hypothetical protein